ncbi:hypothetical protein OHB36_15695 [Streptomyces sp. NBC_00320]|uniref:hypothetical protein n=1 Tax=unclassified Streptomyces TaxID=2593676 RepID=UPI00224D903C|nr:hypothetical protein [Streptomyces sp. NBC_00320]MCX5148203.1 hypothetical protein [Streptomyces sp. NBC_00320]
MSKAGGLGRLRGGPPGQAARTPFVLLVVALLAGGLISLLLLNSALNQGSFQLSRLKKETTALTDEEQALQRDVDGYSAPDALQRRAHELGLVPGGSPVFIGPDGKVAGTAAVAEPPPPTQSAAPGPSQPAAPGTAPGGTAGSAPGGAPAGAPPGGAGAAQAGTQGSASGGPQAPAQTGGPAGTPGSAPVGGAPQTGQSVPGGAPQSNPTPGR